MKKKYESVGKILYKNDGWIVLSCDHSIVNYYKTVIEKMIWKKLSTSFHGAHVTVLAAKHNGDFRKHKNWGKYNEKLVKFNYSPIIYTNELVGKDRYFWLNITCPFISLIRKDFNLDPNLKWPTHLTIGYLSY